MSSVFTQEAISIASSILAIICLSVPLLFKKELKGIREKYYLIAFYVSAIVHFLTVANPNADDSVAISVFKSISIVNGHCYREPNNKFHVPS
ncbi:hypothetical protein AVL56_19490 [Alteromonas stellipolaris]|uniref:hypothetical protein n=1 Tax=Alteromonas stellipolaris TaxID=233316 RepID=UPI00076FEC1A|nr:hypothetical protein [Alteromonas stellipolaris]AMJ96281.1 hypothetical protein AVL56_19490 [Alteromonas stellipolaris]